MQTIGRYAIETSNEVTGGGSHEPATPMPVTVSDSPRIGRHPRRACKIQARGPNIRHERPKGAISPITAQTRQAARVRRQISRSGDGLDGSLAAAGPHTLDR